MSDDYISQLKAIPLTDILQNVYGVALRKAGDKYYCKIRDERTSSCAVYPTNTFYDFGGSVGGDTITLVEVMDGCDRKTAMEKLGRLYQIERENTRRDRSVLMDYEWKRLGIAPDLVSKNLNINIIESDDQWLKGADINLNANDKEQIEMFNARYHISVSEYRKQDPEGYHRLLKNKVLHPLLSEKDDYFSTLNSQYRLYKEIAGGKFAFDTVTTDPENEQTAKDISERFTLLQHAADDKKLLPVPSVKLEVAKDLTAILDGSAQFKVSKISYFELCRYAKSAHQSLATVTVSYDDYVAKRLPNGSELRKIPHTSTYKNGECKVYFTAGDYQKMLGIFEKGVISSRVLSVKKPQKTAAKADYRSKKEAQIK